MGGKKKKKTRKKGQEHPETLPHDDKEQPPASCKGRPAGPRAARGPGAAELQDPWGPPGGLRAPRPPILGPPKPRSWPSGGPRGAPPEAAAGRARGPGAGRPPPPVPPPPPPPPLTLQQPLDDAVDVELVYIRHRLAAARRTPPRRSPPSARRSAGPGSSARPVPPVSARSPAFFSPLGSEPPAAAAASPLGRAPAPHKMAAVPSAGSAGARIPRARGGSPEALYRPGGKSAAEAGRALRLRARPRRILPPAGGEIVRGCSPFPVLWGLP